MKRLRIVLGLPIFPLAFGDSAVARMAFSGHEGHLDSLPILRDTNTARISSCDRSGGNHDWVDTRRAKRKREYLETIESIRVLTGHD